jgi:serine/threonine protein kinase
MACILCLAQAQTLTKIHHKNLVSLIGYCKDGEYLALVYEHMSEGNLNDKLRGALLNLYERHIFTLVQRSRHY